MRKPRNYKDLEERLKEQYSDSNDSAYELLGCFYLSTEKNDGYVNYSYLCITKDKDTKEIVYFIDTVCRFSKYDIDVEQEAVLSKQQIKALQSLDLGTVGLLYED